MESFYVGIDIGSVSVKVVVLDAEMRLREKHYKRSAGQPVPTLVELLEGVFERFGARNIKRIAATGTGSRGVAAELGIPFYNEVVAVSSALGKYCPEVRTVVEMGGQDSKLLIMGRSESGGSYLEDIAMNTLCAAGTGSFLDQQAARLGVSIEGEFGELAMKSEKPPRVAGRCSVFAKSDMIHLQQIATPDYDIVAGLCFAVARNFKSSVARGKRFTKPIAFIGGVAANRGVVRAFEEVLQLSAGELVIPEHYAHMGALGAVLKSLEEGVPEAEGEWDLSVLENRRIGSDETDEGLEPLEYVPEGKTWSETESFSSLDGDEIRDGYLGIDVGSLSTNVVVIDKDCRVLSRRYLPTAGRPIEAVRRGLREVGAEVEGKVRILGVGTTGSGRYLTGDLVGADIVKNEITAQATAALHIDPEVDTIFEIGGQDSKYISLQDGTVIDFEMNKACAAGTGSFLEEQADKLEIDIKKEFGEKALCSTCPGRLGERCTVFMESDVVSHQQKGAPKEDILAGLGYSIVLNYLNRVVAGRRVGEKIFFQGGVAWNKAVVAAFEKVTGKPIVVPPHHDVTGAIGAALLAMRANGKGPSRFKGFDLSDRNYTVSTFTCKACENMCEIRRVEVEGEKPLFYGGRCERYEEEHKDRSAIERIPDLFAEREKLLFGEALEKERAGTPSTGRKRVGIPRSLNFYELFPFWNTFFEELGFETVLSSATTKSLVHKAVESVSAETCFPVKVAHGHVLDLLERGVDYLFLPSFITGERTDERQEQNYGCPYVQALPYLVRSAIDLGEKGVEVIELPVSFQRGRAHMEKVLADMGKKLGKSRAEVKRAHAKAIEAQNTFYRRMVERGKEALSNLADDEIAVVIVSRPYNGCDSGINLDLPKKIRNMGVMPIPIDMLPLGEVDIYDEHPNMYWKYGQGIMRAGELVRRDRRLYAIYVTNFGCGPDSFLGHFFDRKMKGKPYLQIEIDEHSADAGVITRCEAFFDSLQSSRRKPVSKVPKLRAERVVTSERTRTVYFPRMSDHAFAMAAAFRNSGVDARVLPAPDVHSLEMGRQFSSGKECMPFAVTTGDIVRKVTEKGFDPKRTAFFMPTASGPCRFGQYSRMHRIILDDLGFTDVPLITPSSKESYSQLGELSKNFERLAWKGLVATDILEKLARETRPYEVRKGETTKAYWECMKVLEDGIERGEKEVERALLEIRDRFAAIEVDRTERKPVVGVVGEIFLRSNSFSNDQVVEKIEALGGEAWVAPIAEWVFYTNHRYLEDMWADKKVRKFLVGYFKDRIQKRDEHRFLNLFSGRLSNIHEPETKKLLAHASPYMHFSFGGEAILSVGKAIDYIYEGLSGIVNVMPFTCMPGTVVSAISRRVRDDFDNIPWINMAYDGSEDASAFTRLEAFMHQVKQYQARRKAAGSTVVV